MGANKEVKAGFYEREITPPLGGLMPGYFNDRVAKSVKDRLYAKAVVLQNGEKTVAIAAMDACFMTKDISSGILDRITSFTDISPDDIMLCATHTHTGVDITYSVDDPKRDAVYVESLIKNTADCITMAYKHLVKAKVKFALGNVKGISFIRNYRMKDGSIQTNPVRCSPDIVEPVGALDTDLPVLYFEDEMGRPMGSVTCFACHQDCVGVDEYSGDYSSELSIALKDEFHDRFVSVFLAGACGNINHFDVTRESDPPDHYRYMGRVLAAEAIRAINCGVYLDGPIQSVKEYITIPRREISDEEIQKAAQIIATVRKKEGIKLAADGTEPEQYRLIMAKELMSVVDEPKKITLPLQIIAIGGCAIYGFPSEIFSDFGIYVKNKSPFPMNIAASNCNLNYGYIPTQELIGTNIYEAEPGANLLCKEAGTMICNKLLDMAETLVQGSTFDFLHKRTV